MGEEIVDYVKEEVDDDDDVKEESTDNVQGRRRRRRGLSQAHYVEHEKDGEGLDDGVALTVGAEEGPVAGGDGFIVLPDGHGHGTGEDVEGEPLHPLVPVALVELGAVWKIHWVYLTAE